MGGIVWALTIYENGLSFFLRKPNTAATIKSVLLATFSISFFAVVTVRRANALSVGPKVRWTMFIPPLWIIWIPVLGLVQLLTPDDVKRLGQRVKRLVVVGAIASVAGLAVVLWLELNPGGLQRATGGTSNARVEILQGSDDFEIYREAFIKAAATLIQQGRCTEDDFREMGGWVRSTSGGQGIYFTFCGDHSKIANRLYLDVNTGRTYR